MIKITNSNISQFIKFAVVGISGTAVDWLLYFALTRWLGFFYLTAKILSFIIAASNNYIWNRLWTFESKEKKIFKEFSKFLIVSVMGLGINVFIMYLFVEIIGQKEIIGLAAATFVALFWNFLVNKFWTFRKKV